MADSEILVNQSSIQRDLLFALADNGTSTTPELRRAVEQARDTAIPDQTVYDNLENLVDDGLVSKTPDGRSRVYDLSEKGRERVEQHNTWASNCLRD